MYVNFKQEMFGLHVLGLILPNYAKILKYNNCMNADSQNYNEK